MAKPTEPDSKRRVLHAETSEAQARNTSSIAHTSIQNPAVKRSAAGLNVASPSLTNIPDPGRHVDLFQQGQLADERARFRVGAAPVSSSGTPWRRVEWWRGLEVLRTSSSYGVGRVGTRVCAVRELLEVSNQSETRQTDTTTTKAMMRKLYCSKRTLLTGAVELPRPFVVELPVELLWALTERASSDSAAARVSHILGPGGLMVNDV